MSTDLQYHAFRLYARENNLCAKELTPFQQQTAYAYARLASRHELEALLPVYTMLASLKNTFIETIDTSICTMEMSLLRYMKVCHRLFENTEGDDGYFHYPFERPMEGTQNECLDYSQKEKRWDVVVRWMKKYRLWEWNVEAGAEAQTKHVQVLPLCTAFEFWNTHALDVVCVVMLDHMDRCDMLDEILHQDTSSPSTISTSTAVSSLSEGVESI